MVYRGSLLAEIFADGTEHLVVDLTPAGAGPDAASVRVQGTIGLESGGPEGGTLQALQPLDRAALAVPRGPAPSWQAVVDTLSVRPPAMLGTPATSAAPGTRHAPSVSAAPPMAPAQPRARRTAAGVMDGFRGLGIAAALAVVAAVVLCLGVHAGWRRVGARGNRRAERPVTC